MPNKWKQVGLRLALARSPTTISGFANKPAGSKGSGHFEIVSLSGTLSTNGSHLHISISDGTGNTIGGHLLDECIVYTTAEIVIQSTSALQFTREKDGTTDWEELQIKEK